MAPKDYERGITGAASLMASLTLVSRILGYIRDAVIAYVFGAGMYADAFFVAFRVSNLLRRLVGEGALTSSFVPIFTDVLATRSPKEARDFCSRAFTLFFIVLVLLMVLGMVFSSGLVWLMSPGFARTAEKLPLTVSLTRLMFPYMVFIGLMAMAMGVLNSMKHFTAPALSPVLFNISIILAVAIAAPFMEMPVYALAFGVLAGGVLQLLLQVPFLRRYGMMPRPLLGFNDPAIRRIFALMGPAALGVGVYQLNIFVTMRFASTLPDGSVSYLYYAGRVMELPLGVFAVAVSTAVLPDLSRYVVQRDWDNFRGTLGFGLRLVNFTTIPATVGLLVLGGPIIDVLFTRGEFGSLESTETAFALYFYAIGLVPVAASRILSSVFYSMKDTVTPVITALFAFLFNIAMCLLLIGPLRHGGLALATSLSSLLNAVLLFSVLRWRFGPVGAGAVVDSALRSGAASVVMGFVLLFLSSLVPWSGLWGPWRLVTLLLIVGSGVLIYAAAARLLGAPEIPFFKSLVTDRGTGRAKERGENEK